MNILGIETSCDETAAAVIKDDFTVLSDVVLSQDEIHAPYGGVVPELASRQHIVSISYVVEESLRRAGVKLREVDAFGVTQGPGLIGSLLVGLSFAKGLAYYYQKHLIPVDHLEAHVESVFLENRDIPFPAVALVVSGGHTSLFFVKERLEFKLIGRTRDDAAGEALDKVAKFLGLGYPGGPVIDRMAEKGNSRSYRFGLPRMTDRSLDFSFSGLKTAALRKIKEEGISMGHPRFYDFISSFEGAVIQALLSNLDRTVKLYHPSSLILCGGVARNNKLRRQFEKFAQRESLPPFIPSPRLCTDNASMVAALALEKLKKHKQISFPLSLNAYPRYAPPQPISSKKKSR
jgi:N6-L-threonylcarbamoyladenine synthase